MCMSGLALSPTQPLTQGYRVSFPEVKQPGSLRYHPPPSNAEVKERVELYLNFLSGSAWPVSKVNFT